MYFCSLLYDALWIGRDALWPQQFTKSRHTPSCFLHNTNTEARGCYATQDYVYGGN